MPEKSIENALKEFDEKYFSTRIASADIANFGEALKKYVLMLNSACTAGASEEHIKNITNNFLKSNFYNSQKFEINTISNIDSTIKYEDKLLALMEAKKPTNKNEMVSQDNLNRKALWELTLYYLSQTVDTSGKRAKRIGDTEIRRLMITDGLIWVLIDVVDFSKFCDDDLEKHYYKYRNGQLIYANDNNKFYEDIKEYFNKKNITDKLNFVYFDITKLYRVKKNWPYLYKIFKPEFLLKFGYRPRISSHVLNERFYQELLYIMGLKETKENNTIVIKIDHTIKNSVADQVYRIYHIDKELQDEEAVENTFELIIIWLNRLLFIKLFEGQLIAFNTNEYCYHILDNSKIQSFQNLQDLFFEVLGRKDRLDTSFYKQFEQIPYLNSSLFERQEIEKRDININVIQNLLMLKKQKSVLGNKPAEITVLEYIIDFLNSYDFSAHTEQENNGVVKRDIIDASVLGLIFEKLNGYKEGSHYTPSEITEYMCKGTLNLAVIKKINSALNWNYHNLSEIREHIGYSIDMARRVDSIINSMKICDPAVGSGHFLVSALNRLIVIKKELGVLFKHNSDERLQECNIIIEDDTLRILDGQGNDFVYDKTSYLSQQIQETLFNEKKLLIENCLFGVDINIKAVSICNLRLWIELLKNAYYHNGVMETLPNIDINIKCGDSLISKLKFEPGVKIATKEMGLEKGEKSLIRKYKQQVEQYKSVSDKSKKMNIVQTIQQLKHELHHSFIQMSFFDTDIENGPDYHNAFEWAFEFPEVLSEDGVFFGFDCVLGNPPYIQLQSMGKKADDLKNMKYETYARMGDIYCLFYELGYKLINQNGILSFITSNKWMRAGYGESLRNFFATKTNPLHIIDFAGHKIFDSATVDVNIMTYEKGKNYGQTESCTIKDDCINNLSVYVKQNSSITHFCGKESWMILTPIEERIKRKIEAIGTPLRDWNIRINYGIKTGLNDAFIITGQKRNELINTDPKSAEIIRPILRGRDIKRYSCEFADLWLICTQTGNKERDIAPVEIEEYPAVKEHLDQYYPKLEKRLDKGVTPYHLRSCAYMDDFSKQKIAWGNLCLSAQYAWVADTVFINNPANIIVPGDKYLLGILNSKIADFYIRNLGVTRNGGYFEYKPMFVEKLPVPLLTAYEKAPFVSIVEHIMDQRKAGKPTVELESELDHRIFSLYGLSDEEITYFYSGNELQ